MATSVSMIVSLLATIIPEKLQSSTVVVISTTCFGAAVARIVVVAQVVMMMMICHPCRRLPTGGVSVTR